MHIYYFTGTGNSLYAAREVAKEFADCRLIAINGEVKKEKIAIASEFVGIVYPVYCFGVPRIVRDFILKADFPKDCYVFAISTAGAPRLSPSLVQVEKLLKTKNQKLKAGFIVGMPGNYIPLYGAPTEKKQQEVLTKARKKIRIIVNHLQSGTVNHIERGPWLARFALLGTRVFYRGLKTAAKNFYATEKCNSCGVCVNICPTANIALVDGRPAWGNHCEQCLACLQFCPTAAIEFGKKSIGRKRYQNPFVKEELADPEKASTGSIAGPPEGRNYSPEMPENQPEKK